MVKPNSNSGAIWAQYVSDCPLSFPSILRQRQCKRGHIFPPLPLTSQSPPLALVLLQLWGILGKYFPEISLEKRELPVGPHCLCHCWRPLGKCSDISAMAAVDRPEGNKIHRALLRWPIQHNFSFLWEGSQPASCSPGHPLVDLEGTFLDLNEGSLY